MDTLYTLMPLILLILIMYFLLIRPQKKKEKQINAMRSNIKVGDHIITIGGIYGTVTRVRDESLTIQVGADKTKLEVTRWSVSKVIDELPSGKATKPRTESAESEQPAKKAPRKRLQKSEPEAASTDPVEPNPLEADTETKNPLEEE
ncbi:MAG: preprotein translocase subunit YajC [Anaerovoracaceae bacterium]|jgi:preprotein translocase subunit YajC